MGKSRLKIIGIREALSEVCFDFRINRPFYLDSKRDIASLLESRNDILWGCLEGGLNND